MNSLCPFCAIGRGEADSDLVAFRTDSVFVIPTLKQRPSNLGQVLVCPVAHEASFSRIQAQLLNDLFRVVAQVARAAPQAFEAVGTTMLLNSGAPDQTISHLHVHVIPRFRNDNLVIPNSDDSPAPTALRLELARKLRSALS
jgi:histidine triad (HIT) family protein